MPRSPSKIWAVTAIAGGSVCTRMAKYINPRSIRQPETNQKHVKQVGGKRTPGLSTRGTTCKHAGVRKRVLNYKVGVGMVIQQKNMAVIHIRSRKRCRNGEGRRGGQEIHCWGRSPAGSILFVQVVKHRRRSLIISIAEIEHRSSGLLIAEVAIVYRVAC